MRIFLATILLLGLLGVSDAYGEEVKTGGITFSLGFESFPGKTYYRLESVKYKKGLRSDSKMNPKEDNMSFSALGFRITKMTRIGFENLFAGIEVGMSLALSGYEKPWNLPAIPLGFWGEISYPRFC